MGENELLTLRLIKNEQGRRILYCLISEPLSARDAMRALGLRHRPLSYFIKWYPLPP